jgi:osmotically-inducible protein OsmY
MKVASMRACYRQGKEVEFMAARREFSADFDIGRSVFRNLKIIPELSADDLSVKADRGVITLEGFVRSYDEKRAAEEAALKVNGVKAIASDIVIKPVPERADTEIAKDILREFQSHISIPIEQVKAIVSNGRVRLEGIAASEFERLLAEAAVKSVRGITGIENSIKIKPHAFPAEVVRARAPQETVTLSSNEEGWSELGAAEAG